MCTLIWTYEVITGRPTSLYKTYNRIVESRLHLSKKPTSRNTMPVYFCSEYTGIDHTN